MSLIRDAKLLPISGSVSLKNLLSYPDKSTLLAAGLVEKSIALLPELLSRDLLQSGHLRRVPGPTISATRSYYLVWPARPLSLEATLFRDWLLGLFD